MSTMYIDVNNDGIIAYKYNDDKTHANICIFKKQDESYVVYIKNFITVIAWYAKETAIVNYALRHSKEHGALKKILSNRVNLLDQDMNTMLDNFINGFVFGLTEQFHDVQFCCLETSFSIAASNLLYYVQDVAACMYYHIADSVEKAFDGTLPVQEQIHDIYFCYPQVDICTELEEIISSTIHPYFYTDAHEVINYCNQLKEECLKLANGSEIEYDYTLH